jgi:hypothetical protein
MSEQEPRSHFMGLLQQERDLALFTELPSQPMDYITRSVQKTLEWFGVVVKA